MNGEHTDVHVDVHINITVMLPGTRLLKVEIRAAW